MTATYSTSRPEVLETMLGQTIWQVVEHRDAGERLTLEI